MPISTRAPLAAALAMAAVAAVAGCGGIPAAPRHLPYGERDTARGPADVTAELRRILRRGPAPGGAVLVTAGGRVRFTGAGVSDLRTGRPVGRDDRFRAGSLTKTFLATVVLQLAAERRLGLDDPVERYLPGLVRAPGRADDGDGGARGDGGHDGRAITIRQLLAHTSGLYDYTRDPELARRVFGTGFPEHRLDRHTPRELVATALAHRPVFRPGAGWGYSNTDYVLLGMVVERVTGQGYPAEVRRRIIEPLGLAGTSFPGHRAALPAPHGRGYSSPVGAGGPRRDVTEFDPSFAGAAGELVSTLDDLSRFYGALLGGELLPEALLERMRSTGGTGGRYGLGIHPVALPCTVVWGHSGTINGSSVLVVGSRTGRHVLAYRLNHEAGVDRAAERALLREEFCRRVPAPPSTARP
ncbi:serine hydrolase domain-containing protein [Streptomyces sp. NPDC018031]|uniref:serine hydrolase domain-containing protein n=1 Tax=Streptomyces sp. NPDC018031 TaxID=3365033 RepID=UPI0037A8D4B5